MLFFRIILWKKKPHSADVLNDLRDYWWSPEFIELMAKRLHFDQVHSMLDIGCGIGHWGQLLAPYLATDKVVVGIDPEEQWIRKAAARAKAKDQTSFSSYQLGSAENIPFPDDYFDLVTCQTVLVHVKELSAAITEMVRVLKPGGLFLVAEPNNIVSSLIFNTLNFNDPVDDIVERIRFELICEHGREILGRGRVNRGDIIPYYLKQVDLDDIEVRISDSADYFIPPYHSPREKFALSGLYEDFKYYWDYYEVEMKEFFLAGGGQESQFQKYWDMVIKNKDRIIEGYKQKTLYTAGGVMMYLISGRKKL